MGLQLDGTQSIGLPNDVLVPSNQDFTVFIVAQKEDPLVDDGHQRFDLVVREHARAAAAPRLGQDTAAVAAEWLGEGNL